MHMVSKILMAHYSNFMIKLLIIFCLSIIPMVVTLSYLYPIPKALAQTVNTTTTSSVLTIPQIYEKAQKSVVWIKAYDVTGPLGGGSGFIYDYAGHIITNNHVVTADGLSLGNVNIEV